MSHQTPAVASGPVGAELMDRRSWRRSCQPDGGTKRVLVTGAAGFIGFHVARALKEKGEGVVGLDNFNDYYPVSLKMARDEELRRVWGVHIVKGNLTDMNLLTAIAEECRITHIVHLAAQAGKEAWVVDWVIVLSCGTVV